MHRHPWRLKKISPTHSAPAGKETATGGLFAVPPSAALTDLPRPPETVATPDSFHRTHPPGPCQRCGACCAFYLVSFPDDEVVDSTGNSELFDLSLPLGKARRFMKGTKARHPRCLALQGSVGSHVACSIYEHRPSTCCAFQRSWEHGTGNTLCDRARNVFGLEPFSPY